MKKSHTFVVLVTLGLLAGAWESWTIINDEDGDTFSATIKQLASGQPFIAAIWGAVTLHLFLDNIPALMMGAALGANCWPLKDGAQTQTAEAVREQ